MSEPESPARLVLPPRPADQAGLDVAIWAEPVVMRTYEPYPPDPHPMFLERRVYQGSSGRVYPLPVTDRVSDEPVERSWEAIHLENRYLRLMLLPEMGGRVHVAQDRTTGYDLIYRQNVIKPALVGLTGPWISGGIELNWPQHHRPTTFQPVDWTIERADDGSATAWCSEHEPMRRMKGMHGLRLRPDSAVIELRVRLYNRTPSVETFLWWANIAVHVHDRYQAVFPLDVAYVMDHARRAVSTFPVARGRYYGIDYGARPDADADLRWYRNIPVPTSYMATGTDEDAFGGYDHAADAGFVHVADHTISPGKKLWTWGDAGFGHAWDRNLTDSDGPYIELMAGVFTDNQPDFSHLAPHETRVFSQAIYPVSRIGPPDAATIDAAVRLQVEDEVVRVGVAVSRPIGRPRIELLAAGRQVLVDTPQLAPESPFMRELRLAGGTAPEELVLRVLEGGRMLVEHRPRRRLPGPAPEPAREPLPPDRVRTVEELYLIGAHLERYRHATRLPEAYWQEGLRRDPDDIRCNLAVGLWHVQRGEAGRAVRHLRRAVTAATRLDANPRDAECYHALGLALRLAGDTTGAHEAFGRATWVRAWQPAAFLAMAEMCAARGEPEAALDYLDKAIVADAEAAAPRDLRIALLRRAGRLDEARVEARESLRRDPLDAWAANEWRLLAPEGAVEPLPTPPIRELSASTALDVAHDYTRAGLLDEAIGVLAGPFAPGRDLGTLPMVHYTLGWLHERAGDAAAAAGARATARNLAADHVFPARTEDLEVLGSARASDPRDARAAHYLGNLLYDRRRYREAISAWRTAARLDATLAATQRNLGIAEYDRLGRPDQALACYQRALRAAPDDARLLFELDQLRKRVGVAPDERLAGLLARRSLVDARDDLSLELVTLLDRVGRYEEALGILGTRRFHPWEGGEGQVTGQWIVANRELGRRALATGRPDEAMARFLVAMEYPEHLGEGKHPLLAENELHWLMAHAAAGAGDAALAASWSERAAERQGDTSAPLDVADHWRALALRDLGRERDADTIHRELLRVGRERVRTGERVDHFATSLPDFLVFQRAEPGRGRVPGTYLVGLAHLGLGDIPAAKRAFRRALSLAVDHLESALRLAELDEPDATTAGRGGRGQTSSGPAPSTARTTHIRGSRPVRER